MVNDQAEKLRMRISQGQSAAHSAQIIGIASGKGGVGKSVFCVNFSLALGELGKKVLIIDLDVGMGNIEQLVGKIADHHIADAIQSRIHFQNVQVKVTPSLSFIAGGTGLSSLFHLNQDYLLYFLRQLETMKRSYDYILFDFGAGASEDMLHFILAVNRLILVTTPEPPAMADSYSLIKMVYAWKKDLKISCVVNQISQRREGTEAWQRISKVADRFLGASPEWLAALPRDNDLLISVRMQIPCMISRPQAKYCQNMRLLVRAFLVQCGEQVSQKKSATFAEKVKSYFGLIRRNES